jgi:hypothetical protein
VPTPPLSPEVARRSLVVVAEILSEPGYYIGEKTEVHQSSALEEAGKRLGLPSKTVRNHVEKARERWGWTPDDFAAPAPQAEADVEDLGDGLAILQESAQRNAQYIARFHTKPRVRLVKKEPFAVAFFGDPHLDNKGCDIKRLLADLELVRASRIRSINIGDIVDNFHKTGKLGTKAARNKMTPKEALAAAKWFVTEGAPWDAHLIGNHCAWAEEEFAALLKGWAAVTGAKVHEWEAEIIYQWDDGQFIVNVAHDFKGHSQFNPVHGHIKRALEDGRADLYVAGHRHNAAQAGVENGWRKRRYEFLRVMGYKVADDYAKTKQFPQQTEGHSAIAVIDPFATTLEGRCRTFLNLEEGVEHLEALRRR